jgi:hypothetical protein
MVPAKEWITTKHEAKSAPKKTVAAKVAAPKKSAGEK